MFTVRSEIDRMPYLIEAKAGAKSIDYRVQTRERVLN